MKQSPITANPTIITSSNTKTQRNKKLIIAIGLFSVIIVVALVYIFATS